MARDLFDLAASVQRTADAMPKAQRNGTFRAAMFTKQTILVQLVAAVGADRRLSNLKRGGALNVGFDIVGAQNAVAMVRARGFYFAWVERGTHAHSITPKGRRLTRRGNQRAGAKALTIDGGLYSSAYHPGTEGKHPFQKGVTAARPLLPKIFQEEVRKTIVRAW